MIRNPPIAVRADNADSVLPEPPDAASGGSRLTPADVRGYLRGFWRKAVQMGRLIIGVPDYDTYVEHLRRFHPERTPMTYEAFFIERQNARYKGGGGRCC